MKCLFEDDFCYVGFLAVWGLPCLYVLPDGISDELKDFQSSFGAASEADLMPRNSQSSDACEIKHPYTSKFSC